MANQRIGLDITATNDQAKRVLEDTGQTADQTRGKVEELGRTVSTIGNVMRLQVVNAALGAMQDAIAAVEQFQARQASRRAEKMTLTAGSAGEELAAIQATAYAQALAEQPSGGNWLKPWEWGKIAADPWRNIARGFSEFTSATPFIGPLLSPFTSRPFKAQVNRDARRDVRRQLLAMGVADPIDLEELLTDAGALGAYGDLLPVAQRAYAYQFRDVAEERARRRLGRQAVAGQLDTDATMNQININMGIVGDPNAAGRAITATTDRRNRNNGRATSTSRRG